MPDGPTPPAEAAAAIAELQRTALPEHAAKPQAEKVIALAPSAAEEDRELPEARLLDELPVRLAPRGSEPGFSGRVIYTNDDAMLRDALSGGGSRAGLPESLPTSISKQLEIKKRSSSTDFLLDAFSGFYFGGKREDALNLLFTALALAVPSLLAALLSGVFGGIPLVGFFIGIVMFIWQVCVLLYTVHLLWNSMAQAAVGDSGIPVSEGSWDWWDDAVRPLIVLVLITAICALPAILLYYLLPTTPYRPILLGLGAVLGTFVWPMTVMSVGVGNGIHYARPDWVLICIVRTGPAYLVAWLFAVLVAVLGGVSVAFFQGIALGLPDIVALSLVPVTCFLFLYFGYILFRTLGLIHHHFRERFPWQAV